MTEQVKFSSYPSGYQKAMSLLENVPEEKREQFMESFVSTIINM